jgi:hypothetical protein
MAIPIPEALWALTKKTYLSTKSIRRTAELVGLSKTGTEYALRRMGVQKFPRNRSGTESSSSKALPKEGPRRQVRDPALMREMYLKKKMSIPDIASSLHISRSTVRTGLLQCGIKLRTRKQGNTGKPRPNARGAKHRDWKGGVTEWRRRARRLLNPTWVRPIMERDGFKCRWCESTKKIVAHHLRSFAEIVETVRSKSPNEGTETLIDAVVKEHRLEDGITLCKKCHDKHHKEHGK